MADNVNATKTPLLVYTVDARRGKSHTLNGAHTMMPLMALVVGFCVTSGILGTVWAFAGDGPLFRTLIVMFFCLAICLITYALLQNGLGQQ
jgi:hypothetical protein